MISFKKSGPRDEYEVFLSGESIGRVFRWERRYNLRRVIVSKGWRATTPDGRQLYHPDGYTAKTRSDAAQALVRAREEEG